MHLSEEDQRFLTKRIRLLQTWRYVGAILLFMSVGLGMWLFLSKPLLSNPFVVMTQLENDAVPQATMVLMAAMLPVVVLMCIVLTIMILVFVFSAFSNEKKYLAIINTRAEPSLTLKLCEPKQTSSADQSDPADEAKPRR